MAKSSIEWTDKVWNPVTGCTKVSAGCANCYAETFAHRGMGQWKGRKFEDVRIHNDRLNQPWHWRKPARVFVNSMSDLFHEDVPDDFINAVWRVMAENAQLTFQVLTKRPERMLEFGTGNHNIWLGVSVENQKAADERIPLLFQTPAAVRFLSVEPMLESIRLPWAKPGVIIFKNDEKIPPSLHWVICGGESGPKARPFNIDWARDLRDQCKAVGVPFFMKQMGAKPYEPFRCPHCHGQHPEDAKKIIFKNRKGGDMAEWPEDLRMREFPKC